MAVPTQFWAFQDGQIVNASDLNDTANAVRNLVGESNATILGVATYIPQSGADCSPLIVQINVPGSGSYTIGGTGQFVVINGRVVDNCPAFVQSVTNNSGGTTRTDCIGIQYTNTNSGTSASRQIKDASGNVTTGTIFQVTEQVAYSYTANSTSAPSGFTAFALIDVPAGTNIPQNLRYVIPTAAAQLFAALASGGGVCRLDLAAYQNNAIWVNHVKVGATDTVDLFGGAVTANGVNVGPLSIDSSGDITSTGVISMVGAACGNHGATADSATATSISIVLPAGGTWELQIIWDFVKPAGTTTSITHTGGTTTDYTNVSHSTGNTNAIHAIATAVGQAPGGQTLTFSLNCTGAGTTGLGPWFINAIRTA